MKMESGHNHHHHQQQQPIMKAGKLMSQPRIYNHQQQQPNNQNNNNNTSLESNGSGYSQVQRKIVSFFYIYAILVVTLYVTYAAWYFYHHSQQQQQQQQISKLPVEQAQASKLGQQQQLEQAEPLVSDATWRQEFEIKFKFFEKYVEMLSSELQETQRKLQEREKCDCSLSCTFNGTRYADRSSWQNQCDICACQAGKISCQPQKCPQISCDDPIQLPGQCCPVCMKGCKHNGSTIKHGQKFSPPETNKECKCQDGRIKCEQTQRKLGGSIRVAAAAATTQELRPITRKLKGSDQQQQHQSNQVASIQLSALAATDKAIPTSKDNNNNNHATDKPSQMSPASNQTTSGLKRQVELAGLLLIGGRATSVGGGGDDEAQSSIKHQLPLLAAGNKNNNKNIENG